MLGAILGVGSLLGKLLGGGAKASAEGRRDEASIAAQMAAANNAAQLNAANFNLQAPSTLGRRSLGTSGLLNFAPRGTSGGALALAQSLGRSLAPQTPGQTPAYAPEVQNTALRQALMQMLGQSGQQLRTGSYQVRPQMAQMPKAGMLEKIGGFAGMAGGLMGGLRELGVGAPKVYGDPVVPNAGMPNIGGGGMPGIALPGEADPSLAWLTARNLGSTGYRG